MHIQSTVITAVPTQLWVGNKQFVQTELTHALQQFFCSKAQSGTGECLCTTCMQVRQRQHPAIIWIAPQKGYVVEDLEPIFSKTSFSLDVGQHMFFVLQDALYLSRTCANRLLKILEEPPAGYHFILLTHNADRMLPTITSRCFVRTFFNQDEQPPQALLSFFTHPAKFLDPVRFEQELKIAAPSDAESAEMLGELYAHFIAQLRAQYMQQSTSSARPLPQIISLITAAMKQPPQSGSAPLFWRTLYLQFSLLVE